MPRVLTAALFYLGRSHCVRSPQRFLISPLRDQGRDELHLRTAGLSRLSPRLGPRWFARWSPRGISRAAAEAAEGGAPAPVEEEDERVHLSWLYRSPAHQLDATQVHRVGAHLPSAAIIRHHQRPSSASSAAIIRHHQTSSDKKNRHHQVGAHLDQTYERLHIAHAARRLLRKARVPRHLLNTAAH